MRGLRVKRLGGLMVDAMDASVRFGLTAQREKKDEEEVVRSLGDGLKLPKTGLMRIW